MIPAANTLTQIDDLPGEEIEFGIGDPRWVMRTQADLYSDVTTAIIREYSTNAYDAHVMAGNPDPIEVTLPSPMNPFFVVTDKGVGMNRDVFKSVYTQFGVSDKRESNDVNGMLGYGSKSGIAYTTSFQVTSVRDGIKTIGVVQRKPDWSIVLKVVSESKTSDPNGTEIRIPVHNTEEFVHKANEFYKFWLPGRVLVNGVAPIHAVGDKIAENLYYSKNWNQSYVVMGNVAYRIANPEALFRNSEMNSINFVAYVDSFKTEDGSAAVEFTPSREDLKYTERTKATLQSVIHQFETDIKATAQAEVNNAADHAEAYLAWSKWTDVLGKAMFSNLEFKGEKFRSDFKVAGHRWTCSNSYRGNNYSINTWNVESMPRTMIVTEFDLHTSSSVKTRVKEYISQMGWNIQYVIFTSAAKGDIESVWIKRDQFVDWADLKAALPKKAPKPRAVDGSNNPNFGRVTGSWDYYTSKGQEFEKSIPKDVKTIYYVSVQQDKRMNPSTTLNLIDEKDAIVLVVPENRRPKLLRENPSITNLVTHAQHKVIKDGPSLLSKEAKETFAVSHSMIRWLEYLDVSQIDDPEFTRTKNLLVNKDVLRKAYNDNLALAQQMNMRYNVKVYDANKQDSLLKRYPLLEQLSSYGRTNKSHIYLYLNAAYAAESE